MVEKFAALLTVCSSVEDLEYVIVVVYTVFSEGDYVVHGKYYVLK
jgi:hypothetical protein